MKELFSKIIEKNLPLRSSVVVTISLFSSIALQFPQEKAAEA
jgi:hypothetical protein